MQARLVQTPHLLRNVSDEFNRIGNATFSSLPMTESNVLLPPSLRRTLKPRKCSCRPSNYSLKFPFWNANFSSSALIHGEDCDLFKHCEKENSLNLRFVYCGRLIAQTITASIHLRRGAGGFSISPKLKCSRVVPYEGSISSLVDQTPPDLRSETNITVQIDSLIKRMDREIRSGNVSPHDVDERGNGFLHVSHCVNRIFVLRPAYTAISF